MKEIDWKTKLAAWLHDPAEKALILLRDRQGHEWGTAQALRDKLGISRGDFDKRADWLATAADRPQWPSPTDERYPSWANLRFTERPVLIHPLSGEMLYLDKLSDVAVEPLKSLSFDHFATLAAQRAAPAGSVYWFEDLRGDPGKLAAWVKAGLWDDNPDPARCAEGFNRALLGHWKEDG